MNMFAWLFRLAAHLAGVLQYEVSVVGTLPNGQQSPVSNTLNFVTPSAG